MLKKMDQLQTQEAKNMTSMTSMDNAKAKSTASQMEAIKSLAGFCVKSMRVPIVTEMKFLAVMVMSFFLLALTQANLAMAALESGAITITRSGSQPSSKGPAEYFTGSVRIDPLFKANDPSRTSGGLITFEPGARTAWHTHPYGQILIVTAGSGWIQQWGAQVAEIRKGDVVWIPPGVKHWHGATATTAMTHIAIQEHLDGKAAEWKEKVSDEQYRR